MTRARSAWALPLAAAVAVAVGTSGCDSGPPAVVTTSLPDAYAGEAYAQDLAVQRGASPFTWSVTTGALPTGLILSSDGHLTGTPASEGSWTFQVTVTDGAGKTGQAVLGVGVYRLPAITIASLTTATEGVTYLRGPGLPEQVSVAGGKPPLGWSGAGLPGGIVLDAATGLLSGVPAQATAGSHPVPFTVTDANGRTAVSTLDLQVRAAQPLPGGGTSAVAPAGSPLTDTLTVFTQDLVGNARPDMAVRLRKNGVEFSPVKEQLTDAAGKTVFTGLGLNGATDTVDVTVNGPGSTNASWLKVNSAVVTIPTDEYPVPAPQSFASGEIDPGTGKLIVTGGYVFSEVNSPCRTGLLSLSDPAAGTWSEDQPPGMPSAPSRVHAGMAYGGGFHVLFGGMDCSTFGDSNDTLKYDASAKTWTLATVTGTVPSPREGMAMAGVSTGEIVLFGGSLSGAAAGDTYVYNVTTSTWRAPNPASPPPGRYNAGFTSVGNLLWMCGGTDGISERQDCWTYNVTTNAWASQPSLPAPRQGFRMAANAAGKVYLFGGRSGGVDRNDVLALSGTSWSAQVNNNPPPARQGALFVYQPATGNFLMFGGETTSGTYFSDLWTYNPTGSWTRQTQTYTPPGFTLTGTITGGCTSARSRFRIQATGTSGYVNRQDSFILTDGTGTYSYRMTGIPAGDTIALTVLNEDYTKSGFGVDREWSFIDRGVVKTGVNANFTVNVTLPPGPMTSQLQTVTGTYRLPVDWPAGNVATALARLYRPGYSTRQYAPDGIGPFQTDSGPFRIDFFPPAPGTQQLLLVEGFNEAGPACEDSTTFLYNVPPGTLPPVDVVPGLRLLSPGLSACVPAGVGLRPGSEEPGGFSTVGGVAIADFSGDGIPDLVRVDGDQVGTFVGSVPFTASYSWISGRTLFLPATGRGLVVADFDRNGKLDIAVGIPSASAVAISLQSVSGTFGNFGSVSAGSNVKALAVGDVDGDGAPDLVTLGDSPGNGMTLLFNNGNGTFASPVTVLGAPPQPLAGLASADLNRDGYADFAYGLPGGLGFVRGSATGLLTAGTQTGSGTPVSVAAGDLDGDAVVDLVAADQSPSSVQVWLNTTARGATSLTFTPRTPVALGSAPGGIKVAELTGDSRNDVVFAQSGVGLVELQGTGGGALGPYATAATVMPGKEIAVGDLTLDGAVDVLSGESTGTASTMEWFYGRRPIPAGTDAYSFTAPANTRVVRVLRGPPGLTDHELVMRGAAGPMTVDFPALSTLRPGRPSPVGQQVKWAPTVYISPNPTYSFDDWQSSRNQAGSVVISEGASYIR